MKKFIPMLILILTLCSCGADSANQFEEISSYVNKHYNNILPANNIEFFEYSSKGIGISSIYYGYYYSADDNPHFADFYCGNDYNIISDDFYEKYGGYFWGKPNNGTDWYYTKRIRRNWFYY